MHPCLWIAVALVAAGNHRVSATELLTVELNQNEVCYDACVQHMRCTHYTAAHPNVIPRLCVLHLVDANGNQPLLGTPHGLKKNASAL